MPIISRFYGIAIKMFFNDHNPPHFHAQYEGSVAVFNIKNHQIIAGSFPPNAKRLVRQWAMLHEAELMKNWMLAKKDLEPKKIEPLK